ncbi:unnamed protein product [marine sediment metagenome]|uniref:PIN domain-containing protein n=1 Tax=marine sediment metagenome TaxID=412755 RepID=X0ZRN0_9ZZZZ
MNKVVIDTNIYSNAFRGRKEALNILQEYQVILFSPIVIGELLLGFERGSRCHQNVYQLKNILSEDRINIITVTKATAEFYSHIFPDLLKILKDIIMRNRFAARLRTCKLFA